VSLEPEPTGSETDFGAILIGAGFGGIQMLYELEQLGVSASSPAGQAHAMAATSMKDFTPEQVQELLEKGWHEGGFKRLASFSDVMTGMAALDWGR
jgi:cation diffusion facilitator CzcD-associated flavoprotein CzcO